MQDLLGKYVTSWELIPDGEPQETSSSILHFVTYRGQPAVLKVFQPLAALESMIAARHTSWL